MDNTEEMVSLPEPAGGMTPPTLTNILDPAKLAEMVAERYIRVQRHPSLPLRIYNYTETGAVRARLEYRNAHLPGTYRR